jgi:hypothetical protein
MPGSKWAQWKTIIKGDDPDGLDDIYDENEAISLMRDNGAVFVNDHFLPLIKVNSGVLFMGGSYGTGKTTVAVIMQLVKSMTQKYHRCYYGRQHKEDANNLHRTFITEIKRNRWDDYFSWSETPTGHKTITCNINGNVLLMFGFDDIDSTKGIDKATDIFIDEINQVTFKSFGMALTRLRSQGAPLQIIGCFNNWDVVPGHWLRDYIYNDEVPEQTFASANQKATLAALKRKKVIRHHSDYTQNHFINQAAYEQSLIIQAEGDPAKILGLTKGEWGVSSDVTPYYAAFSEAKHTADVEYNPNLPLWVSFDENYNPYFPVGIFQFDCGKLVMIDEVAAENPNNNIHWACRDIERKYGPMGHNHQAGMFITGDATSKKGDTKLESGKNFFTLVEEGLIWFNPVTRVNASNPSVTMRLNFVNAIMRVNYDNLRLVIGKNCLYTIADMLNVTWDADGKGKDKKKVLVKGVKCQRWGHFSDLMDYFICLSQPMSYVRFQQKGTIQEAQALRPSIRNGIGRSSGNGLSTLRPITNRLR